LTAMHLVFMLGIRALKIKARHDKV